MNAGKGSYVEVTVPYIVEETGYLTKVKGQLMLVDATTSMPFRSLVECETFEVSLFLEIYSTNAWGNLFQQWQIRTIGTLDIEILTTEKWKIPLEGLIILWIFQCAILKNENDKHSSISLKDRK